MHQPSYGELDGPLRAYAGVEPLHDQDWQIHVTPRYPIAQDGQERCPSLYADGDERTRCLLVPHPDGIGHLSDRSGSRVRWIVDPEPPT